MSDLSSAPRPTPEEVEVGVPAAEDIPEGQLRTGDPLEGDMPPLDDPQAVEDDPGYLSQD